MKTIYLFRLCLIHCVLASFRQERARVVYSNPKYVKGCSIFTSRHGRNASYFTNLTLTTLMPYNNNVSVAVTLQLVSGGDFRVNHKYCDMIQELWIINFLKAHSDIELTCPLPPGTYHMFNMKLPPKNIPIPLIASDYLILFEMYLTSTKEQILKVITALHYEKGKG